MPTKRDAYDTFHRRHKYNTFAKDGKRYVKWEAPWERERWEEPEPPKPPRRESAAVKRILDPWAATRPEWARTKEAWGMADDGGTPSESTDTPDEETDVIFEKGWRISAAYEWRTQAVRLAFKRGLEGQAYLDPTPVGTNAKYAEQLVRYYCTTIHEGHDIPLYWDPAHGTVVCECAAGMHNKPCSHAGAVLLLIAHICAPRERNQNGQVL